MRKMEETLWMFWTLEILKKLVSGETKRGNMVGGQSLEYLYPKVWKEIVYYCTHFDKICIFWNLESSDLIRKISKKIWWHFFTLTAYGQKL